MGGGGGGRRGEGAGPPHFDCPSWENVSSRVVIYENICRKRIEKKNKHQASGSCCQQPERRRLLSSPAFRESIISLILPLEPIDERESARDVGDA